MRFYSLHPLWLAAVAFAFFGGSPAAAQCAVDRISEPAPGVGANGSSGSAVMSSDGMIIAFASRATNLLPTAGSIHNKVFVFDRSSGTLQHVSVDDAGVAANADASSPRISADGRYVAFLSTATNLVPGDSNGERDAFVRDLQSQTTLRANVSSTGIEAAGASGLLDLSADGRFVSFWSTASNLVPGDTNGIDDVFVRDLVGATTELVSLSITNQQGNGASAEPSLSADGRYVAFSSMASNLVAGDVNGVRDCFVRDRATATTVLASVPTGGGFASDWTGEPRISADGSTVAYWGAASDMVPGDTNGNWDVFVRDLLHGTTARVSVASDGAQSSGRSTNGRPSADGRYITFSSDSADLDALDTNAFWDAFIHDRSTGVTRVVSLTHVGLPSDGDSWATSPATIDGRLVAVESRAVYLIPNDDNGQSDAFVFDCTAYSVASYCTAKVNSLLCLPEISSVGFASISDLTPFHVTASRVINHRSGLLFYGYGAAAIPFQGGFKCVASPTRRTPLQSSGGHPPPNDCSGTFSFDLNAWIRSGVDAALHVGVVAYCQYWYRDSASASATGLTDALRATILP